MGIAARAILQTAPLLDKSVQAVLAQLLFVLKSQAGQLRGAFLAQEVLVRAVHQRGGVNAQSQAGLQVRGRAETMLR